MTLGDEAAVEAPPEAEAPAPLVPATEEAAVGLGGAVITGRAYNGLEDHCAVQVLPAPQSLALASASVSLSVGQQALLQIAPVPEGSACSLTYKSSKPKCVAVSEDGVLTGLKKGKSVITVATQNGVTAKVKVQVMAAPKTVSRWTARAWRWSRRSSRTRAWPSSSRSLP